MLGEREQSACMAAVGLLGGAQASVGTTPDVRGGPCGPGRASGVPAAVAGIRGMSVMERGSGRVASRGVPGVWKRDKLTSVGSL